MPRYRVELDGKVYEIEGDRPPNEQEARQALGAFQPAKAEAAPEPKAEERSLSGFAGNVASSAGKFLKDTVTGLPAAASMLGKGFQMVTDPLNHTEDYAKLKAAIPQMASAGGEALKNRYGGMEQIKNTLYTDPVGVASDVSTLLMPAKAGLQAGGFSKLAKMAGTAEKVTNPMSAIGAATQAVTKPIARGVVRGTLRPPASVREDFGGSKGVADAVLKDRVYSEASASKKLDSSVAKADSVISDAQASGVRGVPRVAVARSVLGAPKDTARLRTRLGRPDQTPNLMEEAKAIFRNNPSEIPLDDAQAMKREAQTLAYEAGADNQSVQKASEIEKAKALRSGIEQRVPEVGPINEQSQRLLGSKLAFGAAEDRPRALTNFLSILGGGAGFAGGGPFGAVAIPALMKAADSPRLGAMTGIGINELGRGMNAESLRKLALIARLTEGFDE